MNDSAANVQRAVEHVKLAEKQYFITFFGGIIAMIVIIGLASIPVARHDAELSKKCHELGGKYLARYEVCAKAIEMK